MWSETPFTRAFGIALPIVQAPMAGTTTPALVAAVSDAGGLGSHGVATLAPEALDAALAEVAGLTTAPVNFNFFCHELAKADPAEARRLSRRLAPHYRAAGVEPPAEQPLPLPPFGPEQLEVLLARPPAVVSFHFGIPDPSTIARLKDAGCRIMATATCVAEARALEEAGCDAIVAQGWEAGGHRGWFLAEHRASNLGLMALVPQVVDAVSLPVIAAGGIADGRGIAAALLLGAAGVQIGTAFVAADEASTPPLHRRTLAAATDHSTRVTRAISGREARACRTGFIDDMGGEEVLPFPLMYGLTGPLRQVAAAPDGAVRHIQLCGQSAALARAMPAADLVARLAEETSAVLAAAGREG